MGGLNLFCYTPHFSSLIAMESPITLASSYSLRTIQPGSSLYYAILFAKPQQREAIRVLTHFYQEMQEIVDKHSERGIAKLKLQWWSQELAKTSSQHPLANFIIQLKQNYQLPAENFDLLLQGLIKELEHPHFHSFKALADHCANTSGTFHALLSQLFAGNKNAEFAIYLGITLKLVELIRLFGYHLRRGQLYLPYDDLEDLNLTPEQLFHSSSIPSITKILAKLGERSKAYYQQALTTLPAADRHLQISLLILAQIQMALLEEIERDQFNVIEQKISLTPLRKFWIAWRTHAKESFPLGRFAKSPC